MTRIRYFPGSGDPKRLDPTESGSATLVETLIQVKRMILLNPLPFLISVGYLALRVGKNASHVTYSCISLTSGRVKYTTAKLHPSLPLPGGASRLHPIHIQELNSIPPSLYPEDPLDYTL